MKQHITQEQWDQMSKLQKHKFQYGRVPLENEIMLIKRELPNIGQMIEFLGSEWYEKLFKTYSETESIFPEYEEELCDALWEAVKKVLGK